MRDIPSEFHYTEVPIRMSDIEFRLFAPYVESVTLVGSWSKRTKKMEKDACGVWHAKARLKDGEYRYKFRLKSLSPFMQGQTVEITDPLARRVDEMQDDAGVLIIRDGMDVTTEYTWQHDDVFLAQDNELVIYELHVGEFGWKDDKQGTFKTVIERLDYLRDLGVNAVELMPISAFPWDKGWGYNVRHPCAPENAYGTPQDLKQLVDECHARGMRVLMDVVFNHAETEASLNKIDFYYWFRDGREGEVSFGAKFDYERKDDNLGIYPAREFCREVALYWLREYHIDGYRLDATAVIDNYDFIRELRHACTDAAFGKPFYMIAEQIPEDPTIAGEEPDAPVDGAWRVTFSRTITAALREDEVEGTQFDCKQVTDALSPGTSGYVSPSRVVNYIESHDESTLMQRLAEVGITGDAAARKVKLGAALLFTAVGNPMLYQGQEFGGNRPRSTDIRPLQWELLDADYGLHLKEHYAFLAKFRRNSPALMGKDIELLHCDPDTCLIAYRRGYGEAEIVVVANLKDEECSFEVPFPEGDWQEVLFDYPCESRGGKYKDTLPASGAKIYLRR